MEASDVAMELPTLLSWGISADLRRRLLDRVAQIVESSDTPPAVVVNAFRAVVEASKVDQRGYEIEMAIRSRLAPTPNVDLVDDDDLRDGLHRLMLPAPEELDRPGDERRPDREAVAGSVEVYEVA